jgi:hypothetical protein
LGKRFFSDDVVDFPHGSFVGESFSMRWGVVSESYYVSEGSFGVRVGSQGRCCRLSVGGVIACVGSDGGLYGGEGGFLR